MLLSVVLPAFDEEAYLGGAVDTDYRPSSLAATLHLRAWRGW
jgi:hypothetical protein